MHGSVDIIQQTRSMQWIRNIKRSISLCTYIHTYTFLLLGTDFQRAISDSECPGGSEVKRLVFCSGKIYYELAKERQDRGLTNQVALVRIEQVYTHIHIHSLSKYVLVVGWLLVLVIMIANPIMVMDDPIPYIPRDVLVP